MQKNLLLLICGSTSIYFYVIFFAASLFLRFYLATLFENDKRRKNIEENVKNSFLWNI